MIELMYLFLRSSGKDYRPKCKGELDVTNTEDTDCAYNAKHIWNLLCQY